MEYLPSHANMASARLQITVESACNLYNSDGVLAGKSDPYVIVEVPGQKSMKFQTEVISNELNPVWNFTGEIDGFMDGDVLRFTVMDKDTFPKPDDFLGKAELTAQDFYPNGFHGDLTLADSKTQATLSVMVVVTGCSEGALELAEGEGVQMMVPGELVEGTTVPGSPSAAVVTGCNEAALELVEEGGVQMMAPGDLAEGTMVAGSSSAAVYSADAGDGSTMLGSSSNLMYSGIPAGGISAGGVVASSTGPTALVPCVAMRGLPVYDPSVLTTTTTPSQSMTYSVPQTCSAPQTYSAPPVPMNGMVSTSIVGSQPMASQSMASHSMASQSITYTVHRHSPVTVTAEEFTKINGTVVAEQSPVTVGIETVGVETNREVVVDDTETVDKTVKIKKKRKSQLCC